MNATVTAKKLFLSLALSWLMLATVARAAAADTHYAKQGAAASGPCTSWETACDLSYALTQAASGDQVWVASGTYEPTSGSDRAIAFHLASGVAVYGGFPTGTTETSLDDRDSNPATNNTVLSGDLNQDDSPGWANRGDNSYRVVDGSGADATAVLDGFTIRGGNHDNGSSPWGGGMSSEGSPTLANLMFTDNRDSYIGGGMAVLGAGSPSLTNVAFDGNSSGDDGGGMSIYGTGSPSLTKVTFTGNSANRGGGLYISNGGSPSLTDITFGDNTANSGGGVYLNYTGSGTPTLNRVTFTGNSSISGNGGGMYVDGDQGGAPASMSNVLFHANEASSAGGGIYIYSANGSVALTNATFYDNPSGAMGVNDAVYIYGANGSATITNSIVWSSSGSTGHPGVSGGTVTISYSDVQNGWTGSGGNNISSDPLFLNAANGDLRLRPGSPAIDAGDNSLVPSAATTDLAGQNRFVDDSGTTDTGAGVPPIVDMGAHEFQGTSTQPPDLTITKSHTGDFARGQTGATYSITVSNSGSGATSGLVTVADSLPAGLTATAMSGTGWACPTSFTANLACTRSDPLAASSSYPVITLTVNVAPDAGASATNMATVSGGGETDTTNNTAEDVTSITTINSAPNVPSSPSPGADATNVAQAATLSWTGGDPDAGDTVTYQVYLDTNSNPSTSLCSGISVAACDPPADFAADTDYYWKVVATDGQGASTPGPVWHFRTLHPNSAPHSPSNPLPADSAAGVDISVASLSWTGGDPDAGDSVTYRVKFGTANPPSRVLSNCNGISATSCDPSPGGDLAAGTTYYWQVVSTDSHGASTSGSVWSFTTQPAATAAPSVTTHPQSQSVTEGDRVTFTAAASGTPVPAVQWQVSMNGKKWSDISGGTSAELSFTAQLGDSGKQYRALFSNERGSAATQAATLTVTGPPADVRITKSGRYDSSANTITWTLSVTNDGPNVARGVLVTDSLDKSTRVASVDAATYKVSGSTVKVSLGDLNSGGTVTFHIVSRLTSRSSLPVENTATVASTSFDPDLSDNTVNPPASAS